MAKRTRGGAAPGRPAAAGGASAQGADQARQAGRAGGHRHGAGRSPRHDRTGSGTPGGAPSGASARVKSPDDPGRARGHAARRNAPTGGRAPKAQAATTLAPTLPPGWEPAAVRRARRRAAGVASLPGIALGVVVLVVLTATVGVVAGVAAGVLVAAGTAVVLWRRAPAMVLRSIGAVPIGWADAPRAFVVIEGLCATMGLEAPTVARVDAVEANALVVGTTPGSVTVVCTTALLDRLGPVELEGVLAHELCHVKAGDVAVATVAAALVLPVSRWVDGGRLVRSLSGRGREFRTDQQAVAVTRYPPGLRAALAVAADSVEEAAGRPAAPPPPAPVGPDLPPSLARTPAGRCTRWLWTVALGPAPTGADLIGNLDAASVRIAALDEL